MKNKELSEWVLNIQRQSSFLAWEFYLAEERKTGNIYWKDFNKSEFKSDWIKKYHYYKNRLLKDFPHTSSKNKLSVLYGDSCKFAKFISLLDDLRHGADPFTLGIMVKNI